MTQAEEQKTSADYAGPIFQMAAGHLTSRLLYVLAKFEIPDRLADGARTSDDLAEEAGLHPLSLFRVLRASSTLGLFEQDGRRFSLTPLGETLVSGHPSAAHELLLSGSGPEAWEAWSYLPQTIETGTPSVELAWGMPIFDYITERPEFAALFNKAMTAAHATDPPTVVAAYDFSGLNRIVDVGGGVGSLLGAILEANPQLEGVLFDAPSVVEQGRERLGQSLGERCEFVGGDFFEAVPEGGDAYVLSHVLHDWTDDQCVAILNTVRRAIPEHGRLLICEAVVPPGNEPHPAKFLDIQMLVFASGLERTPDEYGALLERGGFRLERVVPTASPVMTIVEARPVNDPE